MSGLVLAWAVLVAPHVLAVAGLWRMELYRRQAFGNYRGSAACMMAAVLAGLGYYTLVLLMLRDDGAVAEMGRWPLAPAAVLLYLQSAFALAAVAFFLASGHRAWRVTAPRPPRRADLQA